MTVGIDKVVNRTNHWPTQTQVREVVGKSFYAIAVILFVGAVTVSACVAGGVTIPAAVLISAACAGTVGTVASIGLSIIIIPNKATCKKDDEERRKALLDKKAV